MLVAKIQDGKVHHMRVTTAGQISLPAEVRRRWSTSRVKITDEGGRLIVEPASENPFDAAIGLLAGGHLSSDDLLAERQRERDLDAARWRDAEAPS